MSEQKPPDGYIEGTVWRTARKLHACVGVGRRDPQTRMRSHEPGCTGILPGTRYLEYLGESALYESGYRYSVACAEIALKVSK